jgi:hypothetical protein
MGKMVKVIGRDLNYFFDLIRCFSILGVVASHVVQTYAIPTGGGLCYITFFTLVVRVYSAFFFYRVF